MIETFRRICCDRVGCTRREEYNNLFPRDEIRRITEEKGWLHKYGKNWCPFCAGKSAKELEDENGKLLDGADYE